MFLNCAPSTIFSFESEYENRLMGIRKDIIPFSQRVFKRRFYVNHENVYINIHEL